MYHVTGQNLNHVIRPPHSSNTCCAPDEECCGYKKSPSGQQPKCCKSPASCVMKDNDLANGECCETVCNKNADPICCDGGTCINNRTQCCPSHKHICKVVDKDGNIIPNKNTCCDDDCCGPQQQCCGSQTSTGLESSSEPSSNHKASKCCYAHSPGTCSKDFPPAASPGGNPRYSPHAKCGEECGDVFCDFGTKCFDIQTGSSPGVPGRCSSPAGAPPSSLCVYNPQVPDSICTYGSKCERMGICVKTLEPCEADDDCKDQDDKCVNKPNSPAATIHNFCLNPSPCAWKTGTTQCGLEKPTLSLCRKGWK